LHLRFWLFYGLERNLSPVPIGVMLWKERSWRIFILFNILPSITTTNKDITKIQLKELFELDIHQAGLFITGLKDEEQRIKLLKKLKKKLSYMEFPLVHIRVDSSVEEVEFCLEHLKTKWMNIHGNHVEEFKKSPIYQFKDYIIAENSKLLTSAQLSEYAGICLDLSHWYEDKMNDELWIDDVEIAIQEHPIYCNHISAIKQKKDIWAEHIGNYNSDFDYLKKVPKEYFGTCCSCLELENSIKSQLEFIQYIQSIL